MRIAFYSIVVLAIVGLLGASARHFEDSFRFLDTPVAQGRGVVFHDRWRSDHGDTLIETFQPWGDRVCHIISANGELRMTIPGNYCVLLDDGGIISGSEGHWVKKWNADLHEEWSVEADVHHDLLLEPETGESYFLTYDRAQLIRGTKNVTEDTIEGADAKGKKIFKWSSSDYLLSLDQNGVPPPIVRDGAPPKFTHFNSLTFVSPVRGEEFGVKLPKGGLLVSDAIRTALALVDIQSKEVVWKYSVPLDKGSGMHASSLLPGGTILFYQNRMAEYGFSQINELDIKTRKITWSYNAKVPSIFYAGKNGSAQRLQNGNYLISHLSNGGGIFEVTREGRIVWDWENSAETPIIPGTLYRARRLPSQRVDTLIAKAKKLDEIERRGFFKF